MFTPMQLGAVKLKHRVVMPPLTRSRASQPDSVPGDLIAEYYEQRASDGGFLVTEATSVSRSGSGWLGAPGLFSDAQVTGWKKVVNRVHAKGGYIFAQLWHTGRSSHVSLTGGETPGSASVDPSYWEHPSHLVSTTMGWIRPSPHRALNVEEIQRTVGDYRRSAQRAMEAGFDGVELHAANGYFIDQFLQDGGNKRTDEYGGSIENRSRLLFEATGALISASGNDRVAVRVGPYGTFNGMSDSDPRALFTYVAAKLNPLRLAYLHIIEPRIKGSELVADEQAGAASKEMRAVYQGKIIAAGGFEPDTAQATIASGAADAIAFGRHFVANPDLPRRIQERLPLNKYDRSTFYTFDARGYTDYPVYEVVHA